MAEARPGNEGNAAVVRELLARGADVNARRSDGVTALHMASDNGYAAAVRELLRRPDASVNAQADDGGTPLMDACSWGHLMAATLLIGHGANLALLNNAGESALHLAEMRVEQDDEEPDEDDEDDEGEAQLRAARHEEHRGIVALLKVHRAT